MKLSRLIADVELLQRSGSGDPTISGLCFDSREVSAGCLFTAVRGTLADGHDYIPSAIRAGARVIVCEKLPDSPPSDEVIWIRVGNARKALALMASAWYGHPSRELKLVGITGTNGKTTVATLLHQLHEDLGYRAGLLSTIRVVSGDIVEEASHTTPDPLRINAALHRMVEAGCGYCFMELSSHAIDQDRSTGLQFAGGVFTNLSRDHLDYHGDFRTYLECKKRFFDDLPSTAFALVNADDRNGKVMLQNCSAEKRRYAIRTIGDFMARVLELHLEGSAMSIDQHELWVNLPGIYNATNLLCVYGVAMLLGHRQDEILKGLSRLKSVEGRFELLQSKEGITAVVDYAHSPDALKNVLETINEANSGGGKVITVVGAGGDRDKGKRPGMAAVSAELSHRLVLTSDNPRNEDPEAILDDMMEGLNEAQKRRTIRISNRKEAIRTACIMAEKGDVILVAGKGHEHYQEILGERHHFNDMEILEQSLKPKQ